MSAFSHNHVYNKSQFSEIPRAPHPLTPPETNYEYVGLSHRATPTSEFEAPQYAAPSMDYTSASHRKTSSVVYINSGVKDTRERVANRSLKWLVVIFPPASFSREHGSFGHALSSGPDDRLSNGLLMPLYPTVRFLLS